MKKIFKKMTCMLMIALLLTNIILPTPTYAATSLKKFVLDSVETVLADLFTGVANTINNLLAKPIGYQITIDDIVFNNYAPVKIDYFQSIKNAEYSELIWGEGGDGSGGLYNTINECYSFFNKIAILVYMVMLVYMGLRIILSSTGQSLSHYKTLFSYWVVGLAILFLYPYAMKYIIQLNDAFVGVVAANKGTSFDAPGSMPDRNSLVPVTVDSIVELDLGSNPFNGAGTDYMSQIAKDANETRRLAMALTYLILTWQLITLVLHYYKRLFMVGFLIAIFPLVAMFYALDKIGDGKSQAFDHWNKEFILNVFIQSFHAIVYVFVCGSIGATKSATGFDYIVIITGATFLFTGEEIVKKIFTQDSGVKKGGAVGLGATAAWSMAKVQMATNAASTATRKLVGEQSAVRRIMDSRSAYQAANAKLNAFDTFSSSTSAPNAGLRLKGMDNTLSRIDNNNNLSEEEKRQQKAEALKLANAVADLNNPNSRSVEELQKAYDTVREAMRDDPNNGILRNLNLSTAQLAAVDAVGKEIANMVSNGVTDPVVIERQVKATLEYTLDGMSEEEQKKYMNMALYQVAQHGAYRYDNPLEITEEEVEKGVRGLKHAFSTFNYRTHDELTENEEAVRSQVQQAAADWAKSFHEDGSEVSKEEEELAEGLMIIANRKTGAYTAEEYLSATEMIKRNLNYDSSAAKEMVKTLDVDVDLLRHGIASKAKAEGNTSEEIEKIILEYEEDVRDGVYDDEISGHELIELMGETDVVEYEKKKTKIIKNVSSAREKANESEMEFTRDIAADILATNEVDVTEGGIDTTTRFLNGQTREDILRERRDAKLSFASALHGANKRGSISEKYAENMKNYQSHFKGDKK